MFTCQALSPAYLCHAAQINVHCPLRMKTITFFSVKGGTGKTTFNLLLASWLKYQCGKRVAVLDLDGPEYSLFNTRERELGYLKEQGSMLPKGWLYPVYRFPEQGLLDAAKEKMEELRADTDYLIIDFGGSFKITDPICRFVRERLLDLVVIPVELDGMIIASAKSLSSILKQMGQDSLLFFNMVHAREKAALFDDLVDYFDKHGLKVSQNRIKTTIKLQRDCDRGTNFLRSTVGFPQKDMEKVNPAMIELFKEVSGYGGE